MRKRTWLIAIAIIVVIIGFYYIVKGRSHPKAITAPVVTPATNNFSNVNFKEIYPANLTLEGYDAKSGTQDISFTDSDPSNKKHEYNILYTIYIKPGITDNQVLGVYVENFIKTYNGGSAAPITQKTIQFAGTTALQFSYNSTAQGLPNDPI
jgi:hypothetical protein